jgi:hypothetical protein
LQIISISVKFSDGQVNTAELNTYMLLTERSINKMLHFADGAPWHIINLGIVALYTIFPIDQCPMMMLRYIHWY